nr:MAG TPA: Head Tail Connector Protein [Caudoviricetes sp.]
MEIIMELEKLKILLGLSEPVTDNKDDDEDTEVNDKKNADIILEFIINNVEEIIKNYCHVEEVPEGLLNTAYRMAIDIYRNENVGSPESASGSVASINEGDTSISFRQYVDDNFKDTLLKNYNKSLNRYRKLVF